MRGPNPHGGEAAERLAESLPAEPGGTWHGRGVDRTLLARHWIGRPILGKIEPKGDRQARVLIGYRQRHRNLTIVLLAELPAILPGDANGMNALLRESRVVDDPSSYNNNSFTRAGCPS